jgi:AmiR/NasT family two-component response regulator
MTSIVTEAAPAPAPAPAHDTEIELRAELDAAREKISNLEIALTTSRKIGVAVGILMRDHRITEAEAFDVLVVASQRAHRKLRAIAEDVVYFGTLEH